MNFLGGDSVYLLLKLTDLLLFGFSGICVLDSEPGEIILEIEMQWDGNPNILLDVKTHVGVALPIQVHSDLFFAVMSILYNNVCSII